MRPLKYASLIPNTSMQDLTQEQFRPLVLRILEEFIRYIRFNNLPLIHKNHAIGDLPRKTHFMGHADHRHAVFSE